MQANPVLLENERAGPDLRVEVAGPGQLVGRPLDGLYGEDGAVGLNEDALGVAA